MRRYVSRVVDSEIDVLLGTVPAVAIDGAKAVGKTATARRAASSEWLLDDPTTHEALEGVVEVADLAAAWQLL